MEKKIAEIIKNFTEAARDASDSASVEKLRVAFLGKKGEIAELMKDLKSVPADQKKEFGQKINQLKKDVEGRLTDLTAAIEQKELEALINSAESYDVTMPSGVETGSYHPITLVQRELEEIFASMGFTVEDYDEIVDDYHCFEALNIPKHHPARDMQDTYYLDNGQLLKTHTSAAQNAIMRKYGAPLRAIFPGRCFRNEAIDACHENTFFQMEGIMIDKNISISNLIYFMKTMLSEVFERDVQVRRLLPLRRAGFRAGYKLSGVRRQGLPLLQEFRLAGALSLRHDPSQRADRRRYRPRGIHRLCLRSGSDTPCHDEVRCQGHPHLQQRQSQGALAV